MNRKISVIGLGYVGLPLAIAAAKANFRVVGIDLNNEKLKNFAAGIAVVEGVDSLELSRMIKSKDLTVTNDFSEIKESEIVVVCVPTPLTDKSEPDLSHILSATDQLAIHIDPETLIIFESTVSPGTTRDILTPRIMKIFRVSMDELRVAFSPERTDPANLLWHLKNTPKLVAGLNEISTSLACEFYSEFVDNIVVCNSLEIAETAKLLENTFRLINISFINELAKFCDKAGIDILSVIAAAKTKPYGFMPFYPSLGVGGHCIPVDPIYLSVKADEVGSPISMLKTAHKINSDRPKYFVSRARDILGDFKGRKILIVGVAYKPNVSDVRESPVEKLILELRNEGASVSWHDDLVKDWQDEKSIPLGTGFDLAILATPHDYLDLKKLGDVPILNTRGSI